MRKIRTLAVCLLCLLLSSCKAEPERRDFFAMDTVMSLMVYGRNAGAAIDAAESRIYELENSLSVNVQESDIARLNSLKETELGPDALALIRESIQFSGETGGCLDITVGTAVQAWGFPSDEFRIPPETELERLQRTIDYRGIKLTDSSATLEEEMQVDLGAIAKGYAADETLRILKEQGISSALADLGGNIAVLGKKADGTDWNIAVRNPGGEDYLGVWSGSDMALVTSGDYQRYFERGGIRYHHIIDPATAAPARSDLRSVTVVCPSALKADAYSTALFVMGSEKAERFWREKGDFELILFTDDARLIITDGLKDCFRTERKLEVLER